MIVLLKMHASDKTFDEFCLKTIKQIFFSNMLSVIRGQRTQFFGGGNIHNENPEEGAWSSYCNDFEKSEWEYFPSNQ